MGPLQLISLDDIVWACNDLIKDVRENDDLIHLVDSFDKFDLRDWIKINQNFIFNYRKRRQETLQIKKKLKIAPIVVITNQTYNLQAEGLHFSLSTEDKDYKMLILIDKMNKHSKLKNYKYKVSFRINPNLDDDWTDKLRVDRIANDLGGGGHKGASSATVSHLSINYESIINWVTNLKRYFVNDFYFSENFL